jgi:hypothetical protein
LKITLLLLPPGSTPVRMGAVTLPVGSAVLWFTFPEAPYEVAACYDPDGKLLGYYTNLIRPPELGPGRWRITDLFLDVWQEAKGRPVVLDEREFEAALEAGWITAEDGSAARRGLRFVLDRVRSRSWPPRQVRAWPLRAVPGLRLRRMAPGSYFANLILGRIIAFGLYMFAAFSITSFALAALPNEWGSATRSAWLGLTLLEAAVLLPLALGGRLPATRWAWLLGGRIPGDKVASAAVGPVAVADERTLFIGTLVMGLAVLIVHDQDSWRAPLLAIYALLGVFLAVFAVCRVRFDREFPLMAIAGLLVTGGVLALLF